MKAALQTPKIKKYAALAALAVGWVIVSALLEVSALFVAVLLLWGGLVVYTLHDVKNRAAYLVFLLAFFLFLLGGEFFELYFGYRQDYTFPQAVDNHAYIAMLVSLSALHVGFGVTEQIAKRKTVTTLQSPESGSDMTARIRRITRIGLYIAVVPAFLMILDAGLYTLENGYLSYYTEYQRRLPGFVESISDLFPMLLFFYLATMPPKKECLPPMLLYLAHGALALITGRRIMFGVAILVLGFYIIVRHAIQPEERWISKKKVIVVLALCPVVLIALYMQRYIRYGEAVENAGNVFDIICRFLSQQGTSINTIKFQKQLEGDSLGCTSLYYTIYYLRGSLLTRHFFDFPLEYYLTRTVETAFETNCLADYIMYSVNPEDFFAGYGLGTSYIAELHHDLGYLGVALGSAVYGFLLSWLYSIRRFSFWKFAIGFLVLEQFAILPRYGADVILRPFHNLTKLLVLVLLIVAVYFPKDKAAALWNRLRGKKQQV